MPYADYTYNCRNPLRRFSHKRRINLSIGFINRYLPDHGTILDYGCADGHMLSILKNHRPDATAIGFEPYPDEETPIHPEITIHHSLESIDGSKMQFDVVTCFEVFEHLSEATRAEVIANISSMLKPGGILLLSVPVEQGPAGLFKGILRRLTDKRLSPKYTMHNLWRTFAALPIPEERSGNGYLDHIGFYFHDLAPQLNDGFIPIRRQWSPLNLGPWASSQLMAAYRKKA